MKINLRRNLAFKVFVFFCLMTLVLYGCKKKSKDTTNPTTPKNYMTFKMNGVDKSAFFIDSTSNVGRLVVMGASPSWAHFIFFSDSTKAGSYDLSLNPFYICSLIIDDTLSYISTRGTLKLTGIGKTYEGTFDYVGRNSSNPNDSIFVTEGKFSFTP